MFHVEQNLYRSKLDSTMMVDPLHPEFFNAFVTGFPKGVWFPVLDKGYVRVKDWMGNDLEVANDAKVSFLKEALEFGEQEARIVKYLGANDHTSPFRHQFIKLEIYAPLMVARQWWRYVIGSDHVMDAWNEASRRYVTLEPEFYIPQWRGAPMNKKQGSTDFLPVDDSRVFDRWFQFYISRGLEYYNSALAAGVAPEQARCFLPAYAMYTAWTWTASLQSICHFIKQRTDEHAQWEIRQYAERLEPVVRSLFPVATAALLQK